MWLLHPGLDLLRKLMLNAMQVESALGPALQAAYTVMQDYGGKMLVFQNAVPSLGMTALPDADRRLTPEDERD